MCECVSSLSERAQWNAMAKPRRGCVALSLALRVRGMFHVILLLCCSSLLNFGYFWQCVCVSCVRVACRRGILSLFRRRRPRDKVLSYDLLKCPNATITRDYYKCIPRVQRTQNRTPQFGAAREGGGKQERKREKEAERGQNNLRLVEAAKVTNCFGPQLTKEILNHSSAPFAFWVQASV